MRPRRAPSCPARLRRRWAGSRAIAQLRYPPARMMSISNRRGMPIPHQINTSCGNVCRSLNPADVSQMQSLPSKDPVTRYGCLPRPVHVSQMVCMLRIIIAWLKCTPAKYVRGREGHHLDRILVPLERCNHFLSLNRHDLKVTAKHSCYMYPSYSIRW